MLLIDLRQFGPGNSSRNPKQLPAGIGVEVTNLDMSQGDFRGMRQTSLAHTLTGLGAQATSLYRMGRDVASDTQYWLATTADADYARSLLASDPTERTYITGGGGAPRYTDNTLLGSPPYPTTTVALGVPAPATAMSLALGTPGSGPNEDRVYVDTFVRANGDESSPNLLTATLTVLGGSTVNITGLAAVPGGTHGITLRRIYVSTGGDFMRILEQAAATTTAVDNGTTRTSILQTGGSASKPSWLTPSSGLVGIIELWSGMHGAFEGKSYSTCVPFTPHAWPIEYRRIIGDTIVGTASWGENWVLATTGIPRVVNGNSPLGMTARPVAGFKQACVSKRSVKGVGHGVCWASNDGLAYVGQAGPKILTDSILTKAQWRALVPSTITGASWGRWYIGLYNDGARKAFMIDTVDPQGIIWCDIEAYGAFSDSISETLYLLQAGNTIGKWDYGTKLDATFKSAVIRIPSEANPGAARIVATTYPVLFTLWADDDLKTYKMEVFDDEPFRLPGDYVASEFQVEITGKGPLEGVFIGTENADMP
jgi:hypothetical protein